MNNILILDADSRIMLGELDYEKVTIKKLFILYSVITYEYIQAKVFRRNYSHLWVVVSHADTYRQSESSKQLSESI